VCSFRKGKQVGRARVEPCAKSHNRTGGAIALKARVRLGPAGDSQITQVREVLCPSSGVHIEAFWSAAATKRARPRRFSSSLKRGHRRGRAHFVAAALPETFICAPKLGDHTSLPGVLRGSPTGLRRARTFSATAPPVGQGIAQGPT
jgi:hypothetical protein